MAARPIRMPSPGFLSSDRPGPAGSVALLGRPGAVLEGGGGVVGVHLSLAKNSGCMSTYYHVLFLAIRQLLKKRELSDISNKVLGREVVKVVVREEVPEEAVEGQEEGGQEEQEAEEEAEEEAPGGEAEGLQPPLRC